MRKFSAKLEARRGYVARRLQRGDLYVSSDGKAADISAGTRAWASFIVCHLHVGLEAAAGGGTDRHCASDGQLLEKFAYPCPQARIYS